MNLRRFFETEVLDYIKSQLQPGFELTAGPSAIVNGKWVYTDAALYKDKIRLAVFEFCHLEGNVKNIGDKQEGFITLALKYDIPYAILCDQQDAYVIDVYGYNDKGYIPTFMRLDEALNLLFSADDSERPISQYYAEKLLQAIGTAANYCKLKDVAAKNQLKNIDLSYIMAHAFEVSLFHSIFLDADFEQRLFSILLKINTDIKTVCRYTTLNTAFRIIDSKKNSLCSIVCMNDKSECYYVDKYLYDSTPVKLSEMSMSRVKELNSNFIMSCSDIKMKDDLTMWRMYGGEAKGVCMVYNVDSDLSLHHFILAPVSYALPDGSHPELEFIKFLQQYPLKKYRLAFRTIDIWKHFFKPVEYISENEIRLLIVDKNISGYKWIQTPESIMAPVVEFDITRKAHDYFPFQLKEIMLGPKCPERDTNCVQMAYRVKIQQLKVSNDFSITMSKIDNYR